MEIDRVDEFITMGWAWVRRVGASVARTVGLRTAVPTNFLNRDGFIINTPERPNLDPRRVANAPELFHEEQNRQMFMKLYGLDVDVDSGDKDLRTELSRYLLQKHERSFQKCSVPCVSPPETYNILHPSSSKPEVLRT